MTRLTIMMFGYRVGAIVGVDLSVVPPSVSFEDTHGHHFELPCTCPQFRDLACGLNDSQLLETLSQCTIALIIRGGVICKFNIGPAAGRPAPQPGAAPALEDPDHSRHPTGVVSEGRSAKPEHLDVHVEGLSSPETRSYAAESSASFTITAAERQLLERSQEIRHRATASSTMYCDFCRRNVPVRRKKRGQFRLQCYCTSCGAIVETFDYSD